MQAISQLSLTLFKFSIVFAALFFSTGCQLLPHALQPSQLRKLNRGPALGRDTYNFSIKDPDIVEDENSEAMSRALSEQYGGFTP